MSQNVGIIDEVRRYFDDQAIPDLVITNKDRVVGVTIKNESCNYILLVCKKSKNGLASDKIKVAEIIQPTDYFHRSYNAPRLYNCCYFFKYVAIPEADRDKDEAGNVLHLLQQMSITIEKENC